MAAAGSADRDTAREMSQENVDVVRAAFDAFTRGDTEAVLQLCAEDIEITQAPELPGVSPRQYGHPGVLEAFAIWPEQWDEYRIESMRVVADPGEHVVVTTQQRGRGKQSGVEVDMEFAFLFAVREGKIAEWRIFVSEDQALEAAGLGE
jgi:ketosteroid isomerase-like protein